MKNRPSFLDRDTYLLSAISEDPLYGYSKQNPILVGGAENLEGPWNERRVLNALMGPNGQRIFYNRSGSLHSTVLVDGQPKGVVLDRYVIWGENLDFTSLYFNMYEYGEIKAPLGLTYRVESPFTDDFNPFDAPGERRKLDEWGFEEDPDDF